MGEQKLAPRISVDYSLKSPAQSTYNWTIANKLSTMGSSNSLFHWQYMLQLYFKYYTLVPLLSPWSYTFSLFLQGCSPSFPSLDLKGTSSLSASSSLFISTLLILIPTTILLPAKHSRIFFLTLLISSPPLSLNTNFWRIFVLFRLFHMYLMRQKLGKNPLINAEVKIFNLLVCSGSFLWSLAPFGNYTWIIRAPCFK